MEFYDFLSYFSVLISILLALIYWKKELSYFFALLALNDIIGFILWTFFTVSSQALWIPLNYLVLFSIKKEFFNYWKNYIVIGLIPILFLNYFSTAQIQHYFVLIVNIILFFIFLRYFVNSILILDKIIFSYLGIVLYEVIIIFNFVAVVRDINVGVNIYYAGIIGLTLIKIFLILARNGAIVNLKS